MVYKNDDPILKSVRDRYLMEDADIYEIVFTENGE